MTSEMPGLMPEVAALISEEVKQYLISKGVEWNNLINFLAKLKDLSGLSMPEFRELMRVAGVSITHPFWEDVIFWSRQGRLTSVALGAAEFLLMAFAVLVVGTLSYKGGRAAGTTFARELDTTLDASGNVADQEAVNAMVELLHRALQSGRWRLKPGWSARDAMLKILINLRTNRGPGFEQILERVPETVDEGPVSVGGPGGIMHP